MQVLGGGGRRGEVHKKPIYSGEWPKAWDFGQFADLRGGLGEKESSGVFVGRWVDTPMHTLCVTVFLLLHYH